MNCPNCQKALPEKYAATFCPYCGGALPAEEPIPSTTPQLPPVKIRWWIFFCVLLAPPLLTLLSAFLGKGQSNEPVAPAIGFFGGAAAGIACGVMLALRLGKSVPARVGLGVLFSCILGVVCIALSLFGCMTGGYQFPLR